MKKLALIFSILSFSSLCAQNERTKIVLESTYPEGFGILIKKEFLIKKIKPIGGSKIVGSDKIYIVIDGQGKKSLLLLSIPEDLLKELDEAFGNNEEIKITGVGYETIDCSGFPAISESVKDEEDANVMVPAGSGWGIQKIFALHSFTLRH